MLKIKTTLILLFLITCKCLSQNYVINGDFETNSGFPTGAAQYNLATGWTNCSGSGSPDYAHTSGTGLAALPNNYFGIVSPHSGNAIMGMILWHSNTSDFREYISHAFSSPLVVGNTYLISFYLTNGQSSGNYGGFGINQVSVAFSTSALNQTGSTPVNSIPQYTYPSVFFDSTWQQISFLFTADSAYNYITIGNFASDANTTSQFYRTESIQAGYYFIDDVEVVDSSGSLPIVALSSSDTLFCEKKCLDFTDLSTNNPTSWQWLFPGADSTTSNLQNPTGICYSAYGSFDVTLIACNANGCDTLVLPGFINEYQNPPVPVISANFDTLFSSPAFSYQWYNSSGLISGATLNYYVYPQQGSYFVVVTDSNGCVTSSVVIGTGSEEISSASPGLKIFPNPSSGSFEIHYKRLKGNFITVNIYDVFGHLLFFSHSEAECKHIVLNLTDGLYFTEIKTDETCYKTKFVIKNR